MEGRMLKLNNLRFHLSEIEKVRIENPRIKKTELRWIWQTLSMVCAKAESKVRYFMEDLKTSVFDKGGDRENLSLEELCKRVNRVPRATFFPGCCKVGANRYITFHRKETRLKPFRTTMVQSDPCSKARKGNVWATGKCGFDGNKQNALFRVKDTFKCQLCVDLRQSVYLNSVSRRRASFLKRARYRYRKLAIG